MQCDLSVIHPLVGLLLGRSISDGDAVNPRRHHRLLPCDYEPGACKVAICLLILIFSLVLHPHLR